MRCYHLINFKLIISLLAQPVKLKMPCQPSAFVVYYVQFLAERDLQAAWISAQSQAVAYQEWIGSDNGIYDEVFADTEMATLFGISWR